MSRKRNNINVQKFDSIIDGYEKKLYRTFDDTFLTLGELMTKFIKEYILMIYPSANTIKDPKKHKHTLLECVNYLYNREEKILGVHALQTNEDWLFRILEGGTKKRSTRGHKIIGYANERMTRLARKGEGGYRGEINPKLMFKRGMEYIEQNIEAIVNEAFKRNDK